MAAGAAAESALRGLCIAPFFDESKFSDEGGKQPILHFSEWLFRFRY